MSQDVFDSINPATTSGTQLATLLDNFKDALMSGLSGDTRPDELTAGGFWIDTSQAVAFDYWSFKVFDGTDDIEIFRMDLSTGTPIIAGTTAMFDITKVSDDAVGAVLTLIKNRVSGTNGQVQASDIIGELDFKSRDSSNGNPIVGKIKVVSSNNMTSGAQGAYFVFESIDIGTNTIVEQMRIKDGKVGIGLATADVALHVRSTTGIKSHRNTDDATGGKVIVKKSRVAGTGAAQTSDELGAFEFHSTDSASAEVTTALIKAEAAQGHTNLVRGTKLTVQNTKLGAATPVDFLTIGDEIEAVETLAANSLRLVQQSIATAASITAMNADKAIVNFTGSTTTNLHGINASGKTKVIVLHNSSSAMVYLRSESVTEGTAANRISLLSDIGIPTNATVELFYSTAASRWKPRSGPSSLVEILLNKDINGGTASDENRITIPKNTKANLDALTRKEGTVVYATDEDKLYVDDGTALQPVGSGAGGINYIANPDAETGVVGYATYADAAGTSPVDGTGGSPNISWTRSTTTPLRGVADFNLVKDAANRQGQGVNYNFAIASADKGKILSISFDNEVVSGTYLDGDLSVWIYDVTNGVMIQPIGSAIPSVVGTSAYKATFQTSGTSTSYRLILHVTSTSASAYTMAFDNIVVGPQSVSTEGAATVFRAALTTSQVGVSAKVIPFNVISKDTNSGWDGTNFRYVCKVPGDYLCTFQCLIEALDGSTDAHITIRKNGSTTMQAFAARGSGGSTTAGIIRGSDLVSMIAGDYVDFYITGDASYNIDSSGNRTTCSISRIAGSALVNSNVSVALRAITTAGQAVTTSENTVIYGTVQKNTHGAGMYNSATGIFTAPLSGMYRVSASIYTVNLTLSATQQVLLFAAKNGTTSTDYLDERFGNGAARAHLAHGARDILLLAGETMRVRAYSAVNTTLDTAASVNTLSIVKVAEY